MGKRKKTYIESNDYEMTKHIAVMIQTGLTKTDVEKAGYLETEEGRLCFAAALERPEYWSRLELESSGAGSCSYLPDEFLERNKHWLKPLQED